MGANMGPEGDIPVTKRESTAYYHNVVSTFVHSRNLEVITLKLPGKD